MFSREAIGFAELTDDERAAFRPVRQRRKRRGENMGRFELIS
jgi:hypothetical protein